LIVVARVIGLPLSPANDLSFQRSELAFARSVNRADWDGAVTVSIEVTEFGPVVTNVEDREHIANAVDGFTGDGVTAQDS
jgi:hypothetical protein